MYQSIISCNIRRKHGVIDSLAEIIKAISLNVDQGDAKRYDGTLEILRNNQSTVKKISFRKYH